ncbi:MAG: hypothetical protein EBT20_18260, partial [Alphaproteobacteria bacterium]|nr:hypothetical protein [Alphaproteobacteria bacterium]
GQMIRSIFLFFRTIYFLRPVQILYRLFRLMPRGKIKTTSVPMLRCPVARLMPGIPKPQSKLGPRKFKFLNYIDDISAKNHWSCVGNGLLWRYNLHYFDWLNADGSGKRLRSNCEFLDLWLSTQSAGASVSWDPYPTSLRIVNWIKYHNAVDSLNEEAIASMFMQARWLEKNIEFHLLANHLFANAKALVAAGCFFEGEAATRWLEKGLAILKKELSEQVLDDGGHFELSPMYHSIILEDILDLIALTDAYQLPSLIELREQLSSTATKMFSWLFVMSHPDRRISFFNDAAFGIAPELKELKKYAAKLGVKIKRETSAPIKELPASGYYRLEYGPCTLIADAAAIGPRYAPGHGHADCLSFEMSFDKFRVFVNGGTSTYSRSQRRIKERSTAYHNTVEIACESSSEIWSAFRVGRRASPTVHELRHGNDEIYMVASHDGYRKLRGKPTHTRTWCCHKNRIVIKDHISSTDHAARVHYILHPTIKVFEVASGVFDFFLPDNSLISFSLPGGQVQEGVYAPEFGKNVRTKLIVASFQSENLNATISW